LPLLGIALICGSVTASAQDVVVGTCNPSIPSYDELQDAVDGVPNGGVVAVCPGRWAQQVRITKSLSLMGVQSGNNALPVVVPPLGGLVQNATGLAAVGGFMDSAHIAAQIFVTPGITVNFSNLALDATNGVPNCSALKPVGIYFQAASGSVTNVAFRNQLNTCSWPAQGGPQGDGVLVQNQFSAAPTVTVQYSSFHNFGWMAVEASANNGGAAITVDSNSLVGPGLSSGNGILIGYGAGGSVTNNSISNALRTGDQTHLADNWWGILVQCANNLNVSNNIVGNTDIGIALYNGLNGNPNCGGWGPAGYPVMQNQVFDSGTDGIFVCGSNSIIQNNSVRDSSRAAINFVQTCLAKNNVATQNVLNGACATALVGADAAGNTISPNDVFNTNFVQLSGTSCTGGFLAPVQDGGGAKALPAPAGN